jgi:hypothetical protein
VHGRARGTIKGGESRGKAIRWQPLPPVPQGDSLQAIAAATWTEVGQRTHTKAHTVGQTVWERCQEAQRLLSTRPAVAFDARRTQRVVVSNRAMVQIEGAKYSVPSTWVGRTSTAALGVEEMCLCWQGETQVEAQQQRGANGMTYRHYLPVLARTPQACRQGAPDLLPALGEPSQPLGTMVAKTHGERAAARAVAKLGAALGADGAAAGEAARAHRPPRGTRAAGGAAPAHSDGGARVMSRRRGGSRAGQ